MISKRIMIIMFTGRKSGRKYSTPVSYFQEGDRVICFTHGSWWKNIADSADVGVRIRGEDFRGYAVAVADDLEQKVDNLTKMMKAVPGDAAFYNVKFDEHGEPQRADIELAAKDAVMIQIQLEG
jgi:deazaflavin-dependent oxidoreductase (nitroreductase family)